MTMGNMVERVAKALYVAEAKHANYMQEQIDMWDKYPQSVRDKWAVTARAAIEAMREPTPEMWKAGFQSESLSADDPTAAPWYAMIDAALVANPQTPEASVAQP